MSSLTSTQDVTKEESGLSIKPFKIIFNDPDLVIIGGTGRIKPTLDDVTGALRNANIKVIGLHGKNDIEIQNVMEKASRRARRDNLFDDLVVADLTNKNNMEMIQEQVARALDLSLQDGIVYRLRCFLTGKSIIAERAGQIREGIRSKGRILIILHNLSQGFDMEQVGIPFGDTHGGCKILLASTNQQLLKDEMKSQLIFSLEDSARDKRTISHILTVKFLLLSN